LQARQAQFLGNGNDQQVRGCSDRRAHAADDRGETHRHEYLRWRNVAAVGDANQDRQEHDDDRRIVGECADESGDNECGEQRDQAIE
jgi:hypothetical protein